MSDAADSMAVARRFATLARKNDPADYELVIHTAYYSMHHAARATRLAANGSAPTNHGRVAAAFATLARQRHAASGPQFSRALRVAYDLRIIADYGRAQRELTEDAAELLRQLDDFLGFCRTIVDACASDA
jgi:uncharacterized protein (UPF0332 family)